MITHPLLWQAAMGKGAQKGGEHHTCMCMKRLHNCPQFDGHHVAWWAIDLTAETFDGFQGQRHGLAHAGLGALGAVAGPEAASSTACSRWEGAA